MSDAPLDRFGEQQVARFLSDLRWVSRAAVAHEAVITSLLASSDAVVPMKLFTIFASDDRAVDRTKADWKRIERALRRVAGHLEWGIRLSMVEQKPSTLDQGPVSTGIGYLRAKRRIRLGDVARARSQKRVLTGAIRALSALADDTRRRDVAEAAGAGRRLLMDAAFLVPRRRTGSFRSAVRRQAKTLAPSGYRVQLTGPWPPYSFVEDER